VGSIGRELIAQLGENPETANALRICGLVDRSGFVFSEGGLPRERLAELRALKASGQPLAESIGGRRGTALDALQSIAGRALTNPILVDATAADLSDVLCRGLSHGFDLVLANKLPLATKQEEVDRLREAARANGRAILCEATVGAGLPVLDTLRKLVEAGDEVLSIEGCPSGTLGFLFGEMSRGEPFSHALQQAIRLGYTEPDPRIDLSGIDVARKALILARAIGYRGELEDVLVESLVPDAWSSLTRDEFLDRASELDDSWAIRVNELRRKGKVLRYRAHVTPTSIAVGLTVVKLSEPLATLAGTDNQFTFTTKRYKARPLVISGPGAGAAVTAAGVFNDLLWLARGRGQHAERAPRPAETRRPPSPRRVPHESPTR
jgi:aspartokinase/homoserine dehydrogenase 1